MSGLTTKHRIAVWGIATSLLAMPLVAGLFTEQVDWDLADFVLFGGMLFAACGVYELAARITAPRAYRVAVGVALATAFLLTWMNLAVGIIGNEDNPANLMYFGVVAVAVIGAIVARFRPQGMARALAATAIAQVLVAVVALVAGLGYTLILTGFFVALWLASAQLFQKAARSTADQRDPL